VVFLVVGFLVWIYTSFAYMTIGKKARLNYYGLAWIPGIGPALTAFRASKMHWWPWLLLIGALIPYINFIFVIAFAVFTIIWHWKMFEAIGRDGWWAILMIIPIVNLILIGIAAWGKK